LVQLELLLDGFGVEVFQVWEILVFGLVVGVLGLHVVADLLH
jgi:hypothetical protein